MKKLLSFILVSMATFSQEKGIYLVHKKNNDSIFLKENKRIKIVTLESKTLRGKFTINDSTSITIKGETINLKSIVKIRRASRFHAIVDPMSITHGSILIIAGVAVLSSGGLGSILGVISLPPGLIMTLVPIINNNHLVSRWEYKIEN
jgi:hypothetical protein